MSNEEQIEANSGKVSQETAPFTQLRGLLFSVYDQALEVAETNRKCNGVSTGFAALDEVTGGLQKGDLIIVSGCAGVGKSTFCQNIARQVATRGETTVAFFGLETANTQVSSRIVASEAKVNSQGLSLGCLIEDDWAKATTSIQVLYESRLFLDDTLHTTVADIHKACNKLQASTGLGLVVIDSLPLITGPDTPSDIWEVARSLKLMARMLDAPVLVTTHLYSSRTERRANRRPIIGDLAGLESYADGVILLYKKQLLEVGRVEGEPEMIEVNIAKQNNGPTGVLTLAFFPECARFEDVDLYDLDVPTGF